MKHLITLEDVYKSYRRGEVNIPVLQGVALEIERGELVALVGTMVVSLFDALTEKFAKVALNNTAVTLMKLAPLMTTLLPTTPAVGVKLVSRGGT